MLRRTLVLFVAAGCASAKPPPADVAPLPPPSADSSLAVAPPPVDDPRVVRCGIDDRPRPVSARDDDAAALLATRLARPTPEPPPMPSRVPLPTPLPSPGADAADPLDLLPVLPDVGPSLSPVRITREDPRLSDGPVPMSVTRGLDGAASTDPCLGYAASEDAGRHVVEVAIASNGRPTTVRTSEAGMPSKFLRCVLERACQVEAGADAYSQTLFLPFVVAFLPPPPPAPPTPAVPVLVTPSGSNAGAQRLAALVHEAASACASGLDVKKGTKVTLTIQLAGNGAPAGGVRSPDFGIRAEGAGGAAPKAKASRPMLHVVSVTSKGTTSAADRSLVGCVVGRLQSVRFVDSGGARSENIVVVWNP